MHTINGKHYYTSSEVCEQFGVTAKTWNRWREAYGVRQYAVGRLVLFPVSEIDRIMRESESTYSKNSTGKGRRPGKGGGA